MKRYLKICAAALLLTGCAGTEQHDLPPQLTEEMLRQRGVTIEQGADGRVLYLTGSFSDEPINDENDAEKAVAALSDYLGCENVYDELRFENVKTRVGLDIYTFQQYYEGLPVDGASVTLSAKTDTHLTDNLRSSYAAGIQLDTKPQFSKAAAKKAAKEALPGAKDLGSPVLAVDTAYGGTFRLIWTVGGDRGERIDIDANTGEVLYAFDGAIPD